MKILIPKNEISDFSKSWKNRFWGEKIRFSKNLKFYFLKSKFRKFWFWKFSFFAGKFYFLELEKKVEYSFDVKNDALSIYEGFRAFPTLDHGFSECLGRANWWMTACAPVSMSMLQTEAKAETLNYRHGMLTSSLAPIVYVKSSISTS